MMRISHMEVKLDLLGERIRYKKRGRTMSAGISGIKILLEVRNQNADMTTQGVVHGDW